MSEREHAAKSPAPTIGGDDDPLIGRIINDRFRVVALLARGGMGKVYRAEQSPLGREVALKILHPRYEGEHDPEFHKRFFLEASTCSKLTHPNTITIFDYGRTDDDVYYIAMELLEGRTLRQALRAEGPFAPERALHIARQICRSLSEAHTVGIVHRDLKPANVFLVRHGDETDFVKVLDFGLVKELANDTAEDLTQTGLFMGSPKYMAPEQIQGGEVDGRTDIYALGVLLYEMLTGRVPFDRANSVQTLMAHVHDPPPPFAEVRPEASFDPALEAVVRRCLAKDPLDRFGSMRELLVALKELTPSGTHSVSMDLDVASMSASFERPRDSLSSSGSRALAAHPSERPGAGTTGPEAGPDASSPAPGRRRWAPLLFVTLALGVAAILGAWAAMRSRTPAPSRPPSTAPSPREASQPSAQPPANAEEPPPPEAPVPRARVTLRSDPPGAMVVVGGHSYGPTPAEVEWVGDDARPGREVTLRFEREGYRDLSVTRTLTGPTLEVDVTLEPRPRRPTSMRRGGSASMNMRRDESPPAGLKGYKAEPY